ncbi:MAG: hypothetical protein SPH62_04235, partial [Candidatus Egerieousia sp.]|nr:hypothetical protein [bacterium]MDY5255600.1 hypothetical protein [Candidatus Egerieousia sp.]
RPEQTAALSLIGYLRPRPNASLSPIGNMLLAGVPCIEDNAAAAGSSGELMQKRPMQAGRWRNADSETPTNKRRCSIATLERYCTKAMRSVGFCVSHAAQEIK